MPGVAAWPPGAQRCFLQRWNHRGSAPSPVAEGLRWEAQPSVVPIPQTQEHMGTCKHPKGQQRDQFSQDEDIRHKSLIFSWDKQDGSAGKGFCPVPQRQGLRTVA